MITKRRICWPNPDATCLEGGCGWCNDHPFRSIAEIEKWVNRQGDRVLLNRGIGSKPARAAWQIGIEHDFFNADTR